MSRLPPEDVHIANFIMLMVENGCTFSHKHIPTYITAFSYNQLDRLKRLGVDMRNDDVQNLFGSSKEIWALDNGYLPTLEKMHKLVYTGRGSLFTCMMRGAPYDDEIWQALLDMGNVSIDKLLSKGCVMPLEMKCEWYSKQVQNCHLFNIEGVDMELNDVLL